MADHTLLDEYKTHHGIAGTANDAMLNRLIPAVLSRIERATGGLVLLDPGEDVTEVHDGQPVPRGGFNRRTSRGRQHSYFHTRKRPIQSVTSVHESTGAPRTYDADSLVDSDTYGFDADAGKVYKLDGQSASGSYWTDGYDTIQIVYRPGWAAADIPADWLDAVFSWVRYLELKHTQNRHGVRSQSVAGGTTSYEIGAMPEDVRELVEAHTPIDFGSRW